MTYNKPLTVLLAGLFVAAVFIGGAVSVRAIDLFGNSCYTTQNGQQVQIKDANGNIPPACQQAGSQTGNPTDNPFVHTIDVAANILALATGAGAVIMIIVSALTLTTSGGNAEEVKGSRRRLMYALIGLFIVAIAWTLTRFIVDRFIQ